MSSAPETRPSLLIRLADHADEAAWREFAQIYTPLIQRLARRKGLQPADADDLAQQVLTAVCRAIDRWQVNPERGRFRTWLFRIAQNLMINALARRAPDRGAGDTDVLVRLHEQPAPEGPISDLVRLEFRREVFRWAAKQVRVEFQPATWEAFWLTAVENQSIQQVANQLDLSCGAIYAARSRVMRRIKEMVAEFDPRKIESDSAKVQR